MILSDVDIKEHLKTGKIIVENLDDNKIDSGWINLSLGNEFMIFKTASKPYIDVRFPEDHTEKFVVDDTFILHPGEFVLGHVKENIRLPNDIAAYVDGKSSLGRIGIVVHVTAGFVDPGYEGRLVLEMTNLGKMPVALHPGMSICKLVFFKLSSPCEVPYNLRKTAKYYKQEGVAASRIDKEFNL